MRRHPRALGERERPESFKRPGDSALRVHSNSLSLNLAMPPAHPRQSAGTCMHRAKTRAPWRRRARCARGQPPGLRLAAAAAANDGAAAVLPVSFARAGSCRVQPSLSHSRGGGAGGGQSQDHPQGPRPEARRLCLPHARLSASRFSLVSTAKAGVVFTRQVCVIYGCRKPRANLGGECEGGYVKFTP